MNEKRIDLMNVDFDINVPSDKQDTPEERPPDQNPHDNPQPSGQIVPHEEESQERPYIPTPGTPIPPLPYNRPHNTIDYEN